MTASPNTIANGWFETNDKTGWNSVLRTATDHTAYQRFEWGEMKRRSGWQPVRLQCRDDREQPAGMVQILVRRTAGLNLGWAPGGPVLGFSETVIDRALNDLVGALREQRLHAVRFDCYLPQMSTASDFPRVLRRPMARMNTGVTSCLDLTSPSAHKRSSHHRRNVRRAEAAGLTYRVESSRPAIETFLSVYDEMRRGKDLPLPDFTAEAANMVDVFGSDALVFTATCESVPVATALVVVSGPWAVYIGGGTSSRGRDLRAGHGLFEEMFRDLAGRGVATFDLGGLDPGSTKAKGVDAFKLGFGGGVHERVGEWEWAANLWARIALNGGVLLRKSRR